MKNWSIAELTVHLENSPGIRSISPELLKIMTRGWSQATAPAQEWEGTAPRRVRRQTISTDFSGETLVIPAGSAPLRTKELPHPFRPSSDFMWLVGEAEPHSVLVIGPDDEGVLFIPVHPPLEHPLSILDPNEAMWEGIRETVSDTSTRLGVETRDLSDLPARLRGISARTVRNLDPLVDELVADDGGELEKQIARRRLFKDDYEIAQLRQVVEDTVRGFEAIARTLPHAPAHGEAFIEGVFTSTARALGRGGSFTPIVGGGPRATIPHWQANTGAITPGELVLIDAGVEGHELYSADIARTLPVSGRYSEPQRDVLDIVAAARAAAHDAARPGAAFSAPHLAARDILLDGLADLGVLPHPEFEHLDPAERGWRWTLHATSHMLGVDTHDAMPIAAEYFAGTIEAGHVLAVEPGLYFSPYDEYVPESLRGIGVRIEDNVVITDEGIDVLSHELPVTADETEDWLSALQNGVEATVPSRPVASGRVAAPGTASVLGSTTVQP